MYTCICIYIYAHAYSYTLVPVNGLGTLLVVNRLHSIRKIVSKLHTDSHGISFESKNREIKKNNKCV